MKKIWTIVAVGWWTLGSVSAYAAGEYAYSLVIEETLKRAWVSEVTPNALLKSKKSPFTIQDKVEGRTRRIDDKGVSVGVSEFNIVDFCIQDKSEPICREIIISDFSYEGLAGLLQGGRGERLKYIVIAACGPGEKRCRYPHLKVGPNPVIQLQKEAIRAHHWIDEGQEFVVAGPFPHDEIETKLQRIRTIVPDAYIY